MSGSASTGQPLHARMACASARIRMRIYPRVPHAGTQVEINIGRKRVASRVVGSAGNGVFEWFEAIELEMDVLYDDEVRSPP